MGRCHDFGVQVQEDCEHPMQARETACVCPDCDAVCEGQFKGCPDVWARGPRPVRLLNPAQANGNGHVETPMSEPVPLVADGGPPQETPLRPNGAEAAINVVDWSEPSTRALRMELEALSRTVAHQQGVVGQLISAYGDFRRSPDNDALLGLVRQVVEDALSRHQAPLRDEMARDSRRLNEVADDVNELRRDHRDTKFNATTQHDELRAELRSLAARQQADISDVLTAQDDLRTELQSALRQERAELSQLLAAGMDRLKEVLGQLAALTADQHDHTSAVRSAQDNLRIELRDALRDQRIELSESIAAGISELRDCDTSTRSLLSDLSQLLIHLQDSFRHDRDATRRLTGERLAAFADGIGDVAGEALSRAVAESEERNTVRIQEAVAQLARSLEDMEQASERRMMQASYAEAERVQDLKTCLAELREALHATHALAAAQREEVDLIDGAMSTLHDSLLDLRTSLATEHLEVRADLLRQRRASSALLKRQLRPIVESLPELVAAAVQTSEEKSTERIERAMLKLRRSLQHSQPADARVRDEPPRGTRRPPAPGNAGPSR